MAVIRPVIRPNIFQALGQGLQAGQVVQGFQERSAAADRRRKIEELSRGVENDPEKLAQLAALDPQRARQIQQFQESQTRQIREAEDRFRKERPLVASQIVGQPRDAQIRILTAQIEKVQKRGGDPSNTQGLLDLVQGNPEQFEQAQGFIGDAISQGVREGFLKAPVVQKPEARTGLVKNARAIGLVEGTPEFEEFIRTATLRPQTQINIGGGREEQKELGKIRARQFSVITERAGVAEENIASLDILDNIDVSTGKAEPMKQAIAAFGASFGLDTSKLANVPAGEAFTAEAGKTVLQAMSAQKGPQTESDMRQIRQTVAGLSKDPRANKFINNSARALSLRRIEQNEFYTNFLAENDTLKGVGKAWNLHKRNVPMISRTLKTPEGLPLFFHEFEKLMRDKFGPEVSQEDIIFTWQEKEKAAKRK